MYSPEEREVTLSLIKSELETSLRGNIVSATVYGSSLSDDYCSLSDIDILVILKKTEFQSLKILSDIRQRHIIRGFNIDLNVHALDETPAIRGKTFWHNNRALYMQIELSKYGKQLIGDKPFDGEGVDQDDLRLEIVKVTSSLVYQARKMLINAELGLKEKVTLMKWCIYGVMYSLAFWGIYPDTKEEAVQVFQKRFNFKIKPLMFLKNKTKNPHGIKKADINSAYDFLLELQSTILNEYRNIYGQKR